MYLERKNYTFAAYAPFDRTLSIYTIVHMYIPMYFMWGFSFQGMFLLIFYLILECVCLLTAKAKGKLLYILLVQTKKLKLKKTLLQNISGLASLFKNISIPLAFFISLLSWVLAIPVDLGGLGTLKNHFFHTFNSVSALIAVLFYNNKV